FFFFFFQAEDGIRDRNVTGVQTCALPICVPVTLFSRLSKMLVTKCKVRCLSSLERFERDNSASLVACPPTYFWRPLMKSTAVLRSEERRVGKECRSQWWGDV